MPQRELTDGSTAIVRGALAAGCDFFAGHPITPASPILAMMLRELPKVGGESHSTVCPIVQGAPDMLKWDLGAVQAGKILSPVIDLGDGLFDSERFLDACRDLARQLGVTGDADWRSAHARARQAQLDFDGRSPAEGGFVSGSRESTSQGAPPDVA